MPRVVFDTVVFVRALINPHGLWGRLIFLHAHRYRLILSPELIKEILEVLHRPEITAKLRSVAGLDFARVLEILGQAEIVEPEAIPPTSRDPKDDKVLATAAAAGVDFLISENQDLLVLGSHAGAAIVTAARFLEILDRAPQSN